MKNRNRMRGMTLIELLTVVTVLAIVATIAVSSYRRYLIRANRTEATTTLLRVQVAQEKFFLQGNAYTTNLTAAPPTGLGIPDTTAGGFYKITVTADPNSTKDIATSYLATATAQNGQTQDIIACQTLTINDQGQKTPAESSGCWK